MSNPFEEIFSEATEMFNIAAGMAEDEATSPECDPVVLEASVDLAQACKNLMLTAKKRGEEVNA